MTAQADAGQNIWRACYRYGGFIMAILEVQELTKTYGSGDTMVTALDHVSFQVEKGEFVAIIGASGSGKSTLMNLIGGIDRPTSGSVRIEDKEIYGLNESELAIFRRRNIGMIYQFYNLIPTLTAEENITLQADRIITIGDGKILTDEVMRP